MNPIKLLLVLAISVIALTLVACSPAPSEISPTGAYSRLAELPQPAPFAEPKAAWVNYHGYSVKDPYQWLKDESYPDIDDEQVLSYLHAENDYFNAFLQPHKPLVDKLFQEFKGRVVENETSVPYIKNGFEYRWEYASGSEYKTRYRKNLSTGVETAFLDEQALAEGLDYFQLGSWDISPNNQLLTYTVDTDGSERYTVVVKNLQNDEILPVDISNVGSYVFFSKDNQGVIISKLNEQSWRVDSINLRYLSPGANENVEQVLFTEPDAEYYLSAHHSSDGEWLIKSSSNFTHTDIQLLPALDLSAAPLPLISKEDNLQAKIDAGHGQLYVMSNKAHVNFSLTVINGESLLLGERREKVLIAGSDSEYLRRLKVFDQFITLVTRERGQDKVKILNVDGTLRTVLEFPEQVYTAGLDYNPKYNQSHVRVYYQSMITPSSKYDYDTVEEVLTLKKQQQIPSGYDKSDYQTERLMVPARDGVQIPVSIVYHKSHKRDGSAPLSLYAYGAYGAGMSPTFSNMRLSLLDRGFAFAIAHVRGGDEMGYQWYLDGKLDKRKNTFNDFVDVADYLIAKQYVSKGNISISGGSAGGQLMGAMVTQAPDYWRSVTLAVPFVDVLNTMLDKTLPLTPPEWQEWGNPIEDKTAFEYILSYSPYDQIVARDYPPMLVTGGLNDPRVTYWEPAKWTARMRANKTDNNLLVMRMNMGAGHFSNTGRYARLLDKAEEYAFRLLAHEIKE